MKIKGFIVFSVLFIILSGYAINAQHADCSAHQQHKQDASKKPENQARDAHAEHLSGVNERGDHAMGFSHEKTTHHFRLTSNGGAIEVTSNDPKDIASRDQIRMHLSRIAVLFKHGAFSKPMLTH